MFRFKRTLAGLSVTAILLTQVGTAFAKYSDVPAGVWYEEAVTSFTDSGYLDATQPRFRGTDAASRAEFVKLLVVTNGGLLSTPPAVPSFNDVPTGAWYYSYMEEAAKEGWVTGDGACYGKKPCYARPTDNINRAEAAKLIVAAFGLESTGAAAQFVDNPSGKWFTDSIQTAADHCVLQGDDSTGRVRPGDTMNRAEMVVMLYRVDQGLQYGVDCGKGQVTLPAVKSAKATDAVTVEVDFTASVTKASAEDKANFTVSGSPALPITSVKQIAKNAVEIKLGEDMVPSHDYTVEVKGVLAEDGTKINGTAKFAGFTAIVKGNGDLEVSVASKNPKGDTLPKGAVGVVMLSTDFTASCSDKVEVENVTVLHEGFGESSDIQGVYLAVNGARVSRKRVIDSQAQTAELRFSSPLVIDKCETVTVDLVADFSSTATASAEHNLVVELPTDVSSNAKNVTGNFPLRGDTFRVAAITSGIITVSYRSVNPSTVKVGDKGVVVGKFEVQANSTEDQTLYSVTLQQNSSASDGDVANLAIRRTDGTVLTNTVAQTVGDFVTLVFDPPFTVLEGDRITLEVIGDVMNGADKSVQLQFEESSDLFAVGSLYGYGVNGQLYGSQVAIPTSTTAATVSIDAGQFTIGINGPSTTQYTSNTKDAVLANIDFATGGENVDVKNLYIAVLAQSSSGGYMCANGGAIGTACSSTNGGAAVTVQNMMEGVQIRNKTTGHSVTGVPLDGTGLGDALVAVKGQYQVYRFDDFVIKGKETWQFKVNFKSNSSSHPYNGDKFRIYVCGEPTNILDTNGNLTTNSSTCSFGGAITGTTAYQMKVEGVSTGDKVGDVRPRGDIAGNVQQVVDATLTVEVKTMATSDTAVKNATDVNLLQFEAKASAAEDLLLTKAVFEAASGSLLNASNYTLWVDQDGNGKVDTILESDVASQSSQVSFTQLAGGGYMVPKNKSALFEVHAKVASVLQTSPDLQLRFATGSSVTYLEAVKMADGSSLSGLKLNSTCTATGGCNIVLKTNAATAWTFLTSGNLFVNLDTTSYSPRQLLAGTLSEPLLRLKMYADKEDVQMKALTINSSGSTASSISSLELWKDGDTKAFATSGSCGSNRVLTSNPGGGASNTSTTAFCFTFSTGEFIIKKGDTSSGIVNVRANLKTGNAGATSGQKIVLWLDQTAASDESTGSGAVRAQGVASSGDLSRNDGNSVGGGEIFIGTTTPGANVKNVFSGFNTVVFTKIKSITNGGAATGTVTANTTDIGTFTFTTSDSLNGNDPTAALSGIVFTVNATNVALDDTKFVVYKKNQSDQTSACSPYTTTGVAMNGVGSGSFLVGCNGIPTTIGTIGKNASLTLVLQGFVFNTNTAASNGGTSLLQVSLTDFTKVAKSTFGQASNQARVQWIDQDTNPSGATSQKFTWIEYSDPAVSSTTYRG